MMDKEFIETVVAACRRIPNAEAVNLGGSRARGISDPIAIGTSPSITGERSTLSHSRPWAGPAEYFVPSNGAR